MDKPTLELPPVARSGVHKPPLFIRLWKRVTRGHAVLFAWVVITLFVAMAVAAPLIAPHDPLKQGLSSRLMPPFWISGGSRENLLGTDQLGRDILSRIIFGARVSLFVGISTALISGVIGVMVGVTSGYYGGLIDEIIMRIVEVRLSIPLILLLIAVLAIFGPGLRNVILLLAITEWVVYARVVRAEALAVQAREFVDAARAIGSLNTRIILRHVLPNVISSAIIIGSVDVGNIILLESSLSFLGIGVLPPTPSWGNMLGEGRDYLMNAWWLATFPGMALAITVLSINIVGDWLRDLVDPRSEIYR